MCIVVALFCFGAAGLYAVRYNSFTAARLQYEQVLSENERLRAKLRYEMHYGLRKRENYDRPVPFSDWTSSMTKLARWAYGERQELQSTDVVLQFYRESVGPFEVLGESGFAIERNGRLSQKLKSRS